MKRMKKTQTWTMGCAIILAVTLLVIGVSMRTTEVSAGSSEIIIDNDSFVEMLDVTKWNNPNKEIVVEEGRIIFPAESDGDTRLITKNAIKASSHEERLYQADYVLRLLTLPRGQKFMVAFGLDTMESYYEEAGNLELVFQNNGGLRVSVVAYDQNGESKVLVAPQSCGAAIGSNIGISVSATTSGRVKITVNGRKLYHAQSPVDLEGRVGFLQSGNCKAEISSLKLVSYAYDTPENVNIKEDFESGGINVNALTSKMVSSNNYFPSAVQVEEHNGNQVLMFRNAGISYFGTRYVYSNFEVSFDIPYYQYKNKLRENGTIQSPSSGNIILAIGDEMADYTASGYNAATEGIVFSPERVYSLKDNSKMVDISTRNFVSEGKNEGYSVKVSVVDAVITVSLKALGDSRYEEVLTYHSGTMTPLGYIHIWSDGSGNFAIDNFNVTNKDKAAKVKEVEYKVSKLEGTEDWEYQPQEHTYLRVEQEETNGISPVILYIPAVSLALVILGGCYIIGQKRNRTREVKQDER